MEPMDLDNDTSPSGEHHFSLSPDVSDMDVDSSPLRYDGVPQDESDQLLHKDSLEQQSRDSLSTPVKKGKTFAKTGYGIPDDDPIFSHFPEKGLTRYSTNLLHRKRNVNGSETEDNIPVDGKCPKSHSRDKKWTSAPTISGLAACCCQMLKLLASVIVCCFLLLAATYFVNSTMQRCEMSKHFNPKAFKTDLETFVFGQHLASEILPVEINHYFSRIRSSGDDKNNSDEHPVDICKPLVLSFHGWTGVGKNYVSKIISESFMYTKVNHIVIPLHFPHVAFEHKYGQIIQNWILTNITECSVNIVVIDEMDKAFSPVTEGIISAVEALSLPCDVANPTIILLLSNSYATDINRLFFQFSAEFPSDNRKHIPLSLFQSLFSANRENQWDSLMARKKVIDAYVPFLPLERRHVEQCVKRELVSKRFSTDNGSVQKILEELTFTSVSGLEVSTTGCKRVADKVNYVILSQY
ncbi:torsin-1a-like [Plakobranchus ocellatus]|uniref:Torsin-1a-like n=1 Tax=Plakobranchus ocellatus TaxID=259542 RepID=A0AAV4DN15_9GAST|nr:torsin-1a-like [Plakobranchus ocellatus]